MADQSGATIIQGVRINHSGAEPMPARRVDCPADQRLREFDPTVLQPTIIPIVIRNYMNKPLNSATYSPDDHTAEVCQRLLLAEAGSRSI